MKAGDGSGMAGGVMRREHVHVPGDGRGPRQVYVDGRPVMRVVYADTRRGIVRYYDDPPKMDKRRKRIIVRTRRGVVTVEPIPVEVVDELI